MKKKLLSILMALALCLSLLSMSALAAQSSDVVILYTNDIHTYIDNNAGEGNEDGLTYSKVAALKDSYENALLVDAGDHIQGTAYGQMDSGKTIIDLMNAADYDLATLGNHEFDYGQAGRIRVTDEWADFDYVSCNFYHEENGVAGETVLDSYKIFDVSGVKVAFVGITTPETITSSAPSYFQDDDGNYIYGIAAGADGSDLYAAVQKAIDGAVADGADYVIALGHLGVDPSSEPWTSRNVIANTTGLDAFIDGHSHTTVEMEAVTDKAGNAVVLTQTGSYLNAIGKLTISADGSISTQLLDGGDLAALTPDAEVKAMENAWVERVNEQLGKVIGYSEITLDNYDADGGRLVRKQSTNSGDFSADALYCLFDEMGMDVDVAVMNGGGVRNAALTGEISYLTCKEMHPFGNVACLLTITGQQLLDMLEWGSKDLKADGSAESGSFLHVSGIKYTLDLSYDSTVQSDDKDVWTGAPTGEYRVKDVQVLNNKTGEYEPLDLTAEYNLAGYNYTLRDLGGGFAMLDGAVNVLDYVAEDYMVLANYIESFPVDETTGLPTISAGDGYDDVSGSGRITILTSGQSSAVEESPLYVGGVQVTKDNAADVLGDGTVSYNADTNTLTLKNAVITGGYAYKTDRVAGIYAGGSLNLVVEGTCKVTAPDGAIISRGIYVVDDLNLSGSGTLIASGGSVTNAGSVMSGKEGYATSSGIVAGGSASISGCSVEATGGNASGKYVYSIGIDIFGSELSVSGGSLTASGGIVTVEGAYGWSLGIHVTGSVTIREAGVNALGGNLTAAAGAGAHFQSSGICAIGLLTIGAADVNALGGTVVVTGGIADEGSDPNNLAHSLGVYSEGGLVLEDGANLTATGGSVSTNTANTDYAFSQGVLVYYGDTIIYDAELTAASGKIVGDEGGASYGLCTNYAGVKICDAGAKVTLTSGTAAGAELTSTNGICVYGGDLDIQAGDISITSGERSGTASSDTNAVYVKAHIDEDGISHGGKVTVADSLTISAPENGTIQALEDENEDKETYYTIVDTQGTPAKHIEICAAPAVPADITEYVVLPGDSLWKIAKTYYGSGNLWSILYVANAATIKDPALIFPGQILQVPDPAGV